MTELKKVLAEHTCNKRIPDALYEDLFPSDQERLQPYLNTPCPACAQQRYAQAVDYELEQISIKGCRGADTIELICQFRKTIHQCFRLEAEDVKNKG